MTVLPTSVAVEMARAFEDVGVAYVMGGSLASTVHGEPRTTADVDFAIQLEAARIDDLLARMQPEFFVQASTVRAAVDHHDSFNAIHTASMIKVDVYVRPRDGIYASEIARAERVVLDADGGSVLIASAEDTLLQKLRWYRLGGEVSDRQWRDVLGIVKSQRGRLDLEYVLSWAGTLGLEDLVQRVLTEGGEER